MNMAITSMIIMNMTLRYQSSARNGQLSAGGITFMMPFLRLLIVSCAITLAVSGSSTTLLISAAAASDKSSFQLLTEAIWRANNNAWGSFTQLPDKQVTVQIKSDINLSRWLPRLHPNATSLSVISKCSDAAGKPRKCIINGGLKYGVFRTFKWIKWSSKMKCSLLVNNFVFANINGSVFEDVFCSLSVSNSIFQNSRAWEYGGAAIRQLYPLSPYGTGWVAFPPAVFSNCLFRNLTVRDYAPATSLSTTGSAYRTLGNNKAWFYNCTFQNCSKATIDAAYGANVALNYCKFPGKIYTWDGLLEEGASNIIAYGANYTVRNTEVKSNTLLYRILSDNFGQSLPRLPTIAFCNSKLSKVVLGNDYPPEYVSPANGTLYFCKTTRDTLEINSEGSDTSPWNIYETCPTQCK